MQGLVDLKLELSDLCCGYGSRTILNNVSLQLERGELLCLLGPNGVGKTTLFKTILGLLPAQGGEIRLNGEAMTHWPRQRIARWMGYVPQSHAIPFPFKVHDVVAMGRTAHLGIFSSPNPADRKIADEAMETLGISALGEHIYTDISGGERQLVLIARALAQQPRILVMDEPTSNLDFGNQLRVMAHIRRIISELGMSVILTTHHPNHALLYATRVMLLDRDKRVTVGQPAEVITERYLSQTYGVRTEILDIAQRSGQTVRLCIPASKDGPNPWKG